MPSLGREQVPPSPAPPILAKQEAAHTSSQDAFPTCERTETPALDALLSTASTGNSVSGKAGTMLEQLDPTPPTGATPGDAPWGKGLARKVGRAAGPIGHAIDAVTSARAIAAAAPEERGRVVFEEASATAAGLGSSAICTGPGLAIGAGVGSLLGPPGAVIGGIAGGMLADHACGEAVEAPARALGRGAHDLLFGTPEQDETTTCPRP